MLLKFDFQMKDEVEVILTVLKSPMNFTENE